MSSLAEENSGANGAVISSNGTHKGCNERTDSLDNYVGGNDAVFSMFALGHKSKHILSSFLLSKFSLLVDILSSK